MKSTLFIKVFIWLLGSHFGVYISFWCLYLILVLNLILVFTSRFGVYISFWCLHLILVLTCIQTQTHSSTTSKHYHDFSKCKTVTYNVCVLFIYKFKCKMGESFEVYVKMYVKIYASCYELRNNINTKHYYINKSRHYQHFMVSWKLTSKCFS